MCPRSFLQASLRRDWAHLTAFRYLPLRLCFCASDVLVGVQCAKGNYSSQLGSRECSVCIPVVLAALTVCSFMMTLDCFGQGRYTSVPQSQTYSLCAYGKFNNQTGMWACAH